MESWRCFLGATCVSNHPMRRGTVHSLLASHLAISNRFVACPRCIRAIEPMSIDFSCVAEPPFLPFHDRNEARFAPFLCSVVKYRVNLSSLNVRNEDWVLPFANTRSTGTPSRSSGGTTTPFKAFRNVDCGWRAGMKENVENNSISERRYRLDGK